MSTCDGLEVADGAPDEVLHVESTSWGSIDLIRPRHFDFVIVLWNSKTGSIALDKDPVEEKDKAPVEEENKVDAEKGQQEGGANMSQSELQIFQIS